MVMGINEMGLEVESWTLYALGVVMILARTISRCLTLGSFRKLQCDDWVMVFVLAPFTGVVLCVNGTFGTSNEIGWPRARFALEELQISTNWLVKACLLILYWRIFSGTRSKMERPYLICTAVSCIISYIFIQALLPVWCYPINRYWNRTLGGPTQCNTYHNHTLTTLISSSVTTLLVLIPVPFIPTPRLYLIYTLLLLCIMSLATGFIGRYSLLRDPLSLAYLPWYIAESTALITYANIPFLTSFFSSSHATRFRRLSENIPSKKIFKSWPRSYKEAPRLLPALHSRLEASLMTADPLSTPREQEMDSAVNIAKTASEQGDDVWGNGSAGSGQVKVPVRKLALRDPPPELGEHGWMRSSVKEVEFERRGENWKGIRGFI